VTSGRAISSLLARLPVRTVLHPIGGDFAWARASDLPGSGFALDSGVGPGSGAEQARGRVEVVVHVPEIRISRLDLPGVRAREARRIEARRSEDLQGEDREALHVSGLIRNSAAGSVLWLVSGPKDVCAEVDAELASRGIRAARLLPLGLALGGLARLLPPPAEAGLTAILWIEEEWSHCVVADAEGWRFDRQIPLKLGFGAAIDDAPADAVAWQEAEHQFVEHVTVELERTFTYVERHLALGKVTRICVCGPLVGLDSLAHALVANQSRELMRLGSAPLAALRAAPNPAAAVALGALALGGSSAEASLLPVESAVPRRRAVARRRLVGLAIASCLLALLSVAYPLWGAALLSAAAERVAAEARRWDGERESLSRLSGERERAQRVLDAAATLARPEPPWSALLVVLGGLMPEHLFVERLEIAREADGWGMQIWLDAEGLREAEAAEAAERLRARLAALSLFRVTGLAIDESAPSGADSRFRITAWVAAVEAGDPDDE